MFPSSRSGGGAYFIDDEPAGVEGFAAVGGADTHPHRHVGQIERSDPMDACGVA